MDSVQATLLVLFGLLCTYPLIASFCLKMTEKTRLDFADNARAILNDPSVSEEHKIFVSTMIDDVFDWRFMAYATLMLPIVVFSSAKRYHANQEEKAFFHRPDVERLFDLHMRSVMAASPLFTALFFVVFALVAVIAVMVIGFSVLQMMWPDTVKTTSPRIGSKEICVANW